MSGQPVKVTFNNNTKSRLTFVAGNFEFEEATLECNRRSAELAFAKDPAEFKIIEDFLNSELDILDSNKTELSCFIGLRREEGSDGTDPKSFFFLDGTPLPEEFTTREVFPWQKNQPSNRNNADDDTKNEQECVKWNLNLAKPDIIHLWSDEFCTSKKNALCRQDNFLEDTKINLYLFIASVNFAAMIVIASCFLWKKSKLNTLENGGNYGKSSRLEY